MRVFDRQKVVRVGAVMAAYKGIRRQPQESIGRYRARFTQVEADMHEAGMPVQTGEPLSTCALTRFR